MKNAHVFFAAAMAVAMVGCTKTINEDITLPNDGAAISAANQVVEGNTERFVPNEILVKFKAGTSESKKQEVFDRINARVSERILTKTMQRFGDREGVYLLNTPLAALEAISRVRGLEIEFAEPNFIYQHTLASNDTYYTNGSLWGMYGDATNPTNANGSQAGEAWALGNVGSSSVYVGIIDEGAMFAHEDIIGNFGNPGEIAGNGIDDDGNGFADDVNGWDFVNNDNSVFDGVDDDHGTHVAGTIGAKGGNGKGVAGVCWNVKMISAKFLGSTGGTTANAIKAVDYITAFKLKGLNMVASNNSWGGGGFSQGLQDAITKAEQAGVLFIAAAGNDGLNTETTVSYPSGYSNANIIAVASITNTGAISSFSNYAATKVDIGAPGSGISSTLPARSKGKVISSYGSYSGTSMATPHVTGGAALYAATHPGSTAATIKNAILSSAVPTASLTGKCVTGGRLNVSGF